MGHTMSIHSRNEAVILEFGLKKPAFRIIVNSPTTHGSIGLTTGLDPAMTLGCGGYGGNITSDNITPRHLLNIKRLAYEIAPAMNRFERASGPVRPAAAAIPPASPAGIGADALGARIDQFLGARGYRRDAPSGPKAKAPGAGSAPAASVVLEFVCEEDVRNAVKSGQTLVVSERAIITPAARELGEQHRIFVQSAPSS
jgi:acetaldehyde dehydrogenase (acetylating)